MRERGVSLIEAVAVLGLSLWMVVAVWGWGRNCWRQWRESGELFQIKVFLEASRLEAIVKGDERRVFFVSDGMERQRRFGGKWVACRRVSIPFFRFKANNTPLFTPTGTVSNFFTLTLVGPDRVRKITMNSVGRVRVCEIE